MRLRVGQTRKKSRLSWIGLAVIPVRDPGLGEMLTERGDDESDGDERAESLNRHKSLGGLGDGHGVGGGLNAVALVSAT